ncbi:MAG: HD domain-containing protein [Candidatus Electryonea clarkiae]|nr:HD domain-containing protein [Candidatus Electryonea clarkiae]MDP8288811.1 HD domain-containing protein [Candidatus Electryonea clarkiae]
MELSRSDHPFIDTIEVGDSFDGYYVLRKLNLGTTRANKPFLIFEFTDRTGHIKGKMWDDANTAYKTLTEGTVVKVRALADEYQGQVELTIKRIRPMEENAGDMTRFLPVSGREPEDDWSYVKEAMFRMQNQGLKKLLENLLDDEEFVSNFEKAPAGKRWHHGYLGGLLEHSASMIQLVEKISSQYEYLDKDLLIAGALLHDVGKIWELEYTTMIDYSVTGRLVGHITMGANFVTERSKGIEELDEETLAQLIHLILSHQGTKEHGSPVIPMMREAYILYYCDEIDSKMNAINSELEKASGGGGAFTNYINLLDTMLYKGGGFEEEEQ